MTEEEKDTLVDEITNVADQSSNDGFNYNVAETLATEVVDGLVEKLNIDNINKQRDLFYNFITWYNAKPKVERNKDGLITTNVIGEFLK
jgi:hypothetical protein